jgi:hypothetical protein
MTVASKPARPWWLYVLAAVGLLVVCGCAAFVGLFAIGSNRLAQPITVTYLVAGTAPSVNLTYRNADGGTSQLRDVAIPWSLTFTTTRSAFLYVSAQNTGDGVVTCSIAADDAEVQTSVSNGRFVIATCSGNAP